MDIFSYQYGFRQEKKILDSRGVNGDNLILNRLQRWADSPGVAKFVISERVYNRLQTGKVY